MLLMNDYYEGAHWLENKLGGFKPDTLLILGSGLATIAEHMETHIVIPYSEIPHMTLSTAPGHIGRLIAGRLGSMNVLIMQGRLHFYEGHSIEEIVYPIRISKLIGIDKLIVTNAAGGINTSYKPGDLMLISDFIKLNAVNPLIGANMDEFGERFPDMSHVFDPEYITRFSGIVEAHGERIHEGVYFYCTGPQFETPAEIRAIRILGADAVGMSTVPECIAARHCGMRILGITLITNMASGILERPLSGKEVIEVGLATSNKLSGYIVEFLGIINKENKNA